MSEDSETREQSLPGSHNHLLTTATQPEIPAENVIFRAEAVQYNGWVEEGSVEVLYDGPDCLHVRLQLWPIQTSSECGPAPGQQTCHLHEQRRTTAASQLPGYQQ